jgi:hypothetical protein
MTEEQKLKNIRGFSKKEIVPFYEIRAIYIGLVLYTHKRLIFRVLTAFITFYKTV